MIVITRTPFRVSFFGGGTDYPTFYRSHGGAVLVTTIDKYCYISCRHLPPFFEYRHRIVYSKNETVKEIDEINHPAVRAIFQFFNITEGLEIHHDGDLPARAGLASSSAFTVGLLNAIYAIRGTAVSKERLAKEAIHLEQNVMHENVGSQDQVSTAVGGLNKIEFYQDDSFSVFPVVCSRSRKAELHSHLLLLFTGFSRNASEVAKTQIQNIAAKTKELLLMRDMVDRGLQILVSPNADICEFGHLLHEAWMLKKSLSNLISTSYIDEIYQVARKEGAIGGKLLGAGGGGFMLLFAPPCTHSKIKEALKPLLFIPFNFENSGTQIIFYYQS